MSLPVNILLLLSLVSVLSAGADDNLEARFKAVVRPALERFCTDCHSTDAPKGDLDLERFTSLKAVLHDGKVWEKVLEQVGLGEMPPKNKKQPSAAERAQLLAWVDGALDEAARLRAGDPGPVVLRRLNNAEYTYTIRDLTEVDSLDPTREFPPDSAAGEGFMNTGASLVMSPSMITKFLDAAKEITSHAVLLPDGFRFSPKVTRRDWTDDLLAQIRRFYAVYTSAAGAEKVNLQGIVFDTNEGGRLPVERYLHATIKNRERLSAGGETFELVAREQGLSAKYLRSLWKVLTDTQPSLLLDDVRKRWAAKDADEKGLIEQIQARQKALWKFASVGHIGKAGGPKAWMEPVNPITTNRHVQLKLMPAATQDEITVYLVATDAGDGNAHDSVLWSRPRLVSPGRPDLQLRDAGAFITGATARRARLFRSTAKALDAVAELGENSDLEVLSLAAKHGIEAEDLSAWMGYLGAGPSPRLALEYLGGKMDSSSGYEFVKGWGTGATPLLVANSSDQSVRIPGNMKAHGIAVHPSPNRNIAVGWRSPMSGAVRVRAEITHAHPECGNGVEWFLEVRRGHTRQRLAKGVAQGKQKGVADRPEDVFVRKGDLLSLVIGPRDGNHACDLTDVELVIQDLAEKREWNLTRELSVDILAANPRADTYGNEAVWHIYTEAASANPAGPVIPPGSLLAKWLALPAGPERSRVAQDLQSLLLSGNPPEKENPDAALYRDLASLGGPLFAGIKQRAGSPTVSSEWSLDPALFGKDLADEFSVVVKAPSVLEVRLPADLVAGSEFVVDGALAPGTGAEGSVQLFASTNKPTFATGLVSSETRVSTKPGMWTSDNRLVVNDAPIIANENSAARQRIQAGFDEFRKWFPAALCYAKIVPVDEVVTLTLFYREDDQLCRLMLTDSEKARLDRLWDELHYVSQDPLKLVDVFEQLWQYATQDADPKVFEPMRQPIMDGAAAFRQRAIDSEPNHLENLIQFARRAYRRPLSENEKKELRSFYRGLRTKELPHEEAFRATLARVFVAPAFLYRLETAGPGAVSAPVSDHELASRLSYFLWSSAPDEELLGLADTGKLREPDVLASQARRMLKEPRTRRLATEFACTWLHVHDFDSLDEKSERHFPTFLGLRGAMYEETIQFFTDLFQRDASLLGMLDADYTFLNEDLAKHYGVPGVSGPEWRRVDGVRKFSRGGLLAQSTILAKQSGASRTSPILRGNWLSEVLLGEKLPRPPKDVPQLPTDEVGETLTVRQLVEKHSSDPKCYHCHKRIDGYGFALEGFDAIGRTRTKDLGDRPVETHAALFDGTEVDGFSGLRDYMSTTKRDVVLRQFCRKLLGFSLGRGIILSDKPLIQEMMSQLRKNDYRFSAAVETIVRSPQFREIRGRDVAYED